MWRVRGVCWGWGCTCPATSTSPPCFPLLRLPPFVHASATARGWLHNHLALKMKWFQLLIADLFFSRRCLHQAALVG